MTLPGSGALIDAMARKVKRRTGAGGAARRRPVRRGGNNNKGSTQAARETVHLRLQINGESREIAWSYQRDVVLSAYSFMGSGADRLPNGNTLITESATGRLFEVGGFIPVIDDVGTRLNACSPICAAGRSSSCS